MIKMKHQVNRKGDPFFNLLNETIIQCFEPFRRQKHYESNAHYELEIRLEKRHRIRFANSTLLQIYTDCADNFEEKGLRQQIIKYAKDNF